MPNSNSTFDYVMQQLSQTTLTLREIAEAADVPYSTLTRIARDGEAANGSVHVFDRLAAFFRSARRHRKAS